MPSIMRQAPTKGIPSRGPEYLYAASCCDDTARILLAAPGMGGSPLVGYLVQIEWALAHTTRLTDDTLHHRPALEHAKSGYGIP